MSAQSAARHRAIWRLLPYVALTYAALSMKYLQR
jgi:hypothetical protein